MTNTAFKPAARVRLPDAVATLSSVYVNGIRQEPGVDYRLVDRNLLFRAALVREGKLGFWRWFTMFLGVAGTYRPNDGVDVVFQSAGRQLVETALPIETLVHVERTGPLSGPMNFDPARR